MNPTAVALAVLHQMRGQLLAEEDVLTQEAEAIPETTEDHNVAEALGMSDLLQKEKGLETEKPAADAPRALSLAPEMFETEVEMGAGTSPRSRTPDRDRMPDRAPDRDRDRDRAPSRDRDRDRRPAPSDRPRSDDRPRGGERSERPRSGDRRPSGGPSRGPSRGRSRRD